MILASGVSFGIGISKAVVLSKKELKMPYHNVINVENELAKVDYCVKKASDELEEMHTVISSNTKDPALCIIGKYIKAIKNPYLSQDIKEKIVDEEISAEYAIFDIMEGFNRMVKNFDDEYICEKSEDVEEIKARLLSKLIDYSPMDLKSIKQECIVVAEDLTPWDVLNMDPAFIKGIVTITGGPTSSIGVMARRMNIPAVTGVGINGSYIKNGDFLIVDGSRGRVIVNPDNNEIKAYVSDY